MRERLHREGMVGCVCMYVCVCVCVGRGGAGAEMGGRARRLGVGLWYAVRWRMFGGLGWIGVRDGCLA